MLPFLDPDALNPIEPLTMDITHLKKQYGDRISLVGNLDMTILQSGSPDDVASEVERLWREVGRHGGWLLSSSNSIDAGAKPENVAAMGKALNALRTREKGGAP